MTSRPGFKPPLSFLFGTRHPAFRRSGPPKVGLRLKGSVEQALAGSGNQGRRFVLDPEGGEATTESASAAVSFNTDFRLSVRCTVVVPVDSTWTVKRETVRPTDTRLRVVGNQHLEADHRALITNLRVAQVPCRWILGNGPFQRQVDTHWFIGKGIIGKVDLRFRISRPMVVLGDAWFGVTGDHRLEGDAIFQIGRDVGVETATRFTVFQVVVSETHLIAVGDG